jgi:hypothetical protein
MIGNSTDIICDLVDYVMPNLFPYESSMYLLLLRLSILHDGSRTVRIGKRRIAEQVGRSSRASAPISYAQVTEVLKGLEEKGCILVGDTTREGKLYTVLIPRDIPFVKEKLALDSQSVPEDDYFNNIDKRILLFERDKWVCQYCGEKVTKENATLDHYVPQSKNGNNSKENLRTCCLLCNSIKSGKSFEEAAPLILKGVAERRQRRTE